MQTGKRFGGPPGMLESVEAEQPRVQAGDSTVAVVAHKQAEAGRVVQMQVLKLPHTLAGQVQRMTAAGMALADWTCKVETGTQAPDK